MSARRPTSEGLSPLLKRLVGTVEATLGEVVAEAEGPALYEAVEAVRQRMVAVREGGPARAERALAEANALLGALDTRQRAALARAYTLYLELVNLCENAYRTHRLRARWRDEPPRADPGARATVVYVLTAHPTESRSQENIQLLRRAQALLIEALERREPPDEARLRHLLHLVWRAGTHPPHKPSVEDEARHLFSLVSDPILEELLRLRARGHTVLLRTWVGGDKDGHPGVGPEETDASLNLSRARLLEFVEGRLLREVEADAALFGEEALARAWRALREALGGLRRVTIGDGRRLALLRQALAELGQRYRAARGAVHPRLLALERLLELFPGLVIPLELREERGRFGPSDPISDMLHYVGDVARGGRVEAYVRGLVVSMTDRPQDLWEAEERVRAELGAAAVPVIPLFEMPDVLPRAAAILDGALADEAFAAALEARGRQVEVMLGYSDTSKRMGVLASRLAIQDAMVELSRWAKERELDLVFFHGSGGSEGRGGGRIEDRAAGWPPGSLAVLKETLQGEMVERTLATPEILRSNVEKVAALQAAPPRFRRAGELARELAAGASTTYAQVVGAPEFGALLARATPYARLGALNIGSRPVARSANRAAERVASAGLEGLRAIPWVLCWTQTRYLLPVWLGVGATWRRIRRAPGGRARLRRALAQDPFLRSYVRLLGFTLAKTAPRVWRAYVDRLAGGDGAVARRLERDYQDALDLARAASPGGEPLAERRWLEESIHLRAPMIHPLNLLQIDVLEHERLSPSQELLFRETVTGIAAGMLTTG